MKYQKNNNIIIIINLLDKEVTQWSKFKTNNWVKINDDACGRSGTNSHITFKSTMLKLILCD